jgi:hypothetical protein
MKKLVVSAFLVVSALQPIAKACSSTEAKKAAESHLAETFKITNPSSLEVDLSSKPSRSRIGNPLDVQSRAEFTASYYDSLSKDLGVNAVKKDLTGSRGKHLASYRIVEGGAKTGMGLLSIDQECKVSAIRALDLSQKN